MHGRATSSFYISLLVDQIDICDITDIRFGPYLAVLLVAQPKCSVVNVLLYMNQILFKPRELQAQSLRNLTYFKTLHWIKNQKQQQQQTMQNKYKFESNQYFRWNLKLRSFLVMFGL